MRDPRQYTRALLICQGCLTAVYIVIGCVIYYYCGSYVASPALGSAGGIVKKVSYGLALPGLIVTATIVSHVRFAGTMHLELTDTFLLRVQIPAKFIFIHILRGSRHLTSNTPIHWITWLCCTFGITVIAYIIASAISVFDSLVSLIGALLGSLMCFQPMGCMWLYDNWAGGSVSSKRWCFMVSFSVFVILVGTFLMVGGAYGSVVAIIDSYNESGGRLLLLVLITQIPHELYVSVTGSFGRKERTEVRISQ